MKSILLIICYSVFCSVGISQPIKEKEVPLKVLEGVKKSLPMAKNITWEKKDTNYVANFILAEKEAAALYTVEGTLVQIGIHIPLSELPALALDYLKLNYAKQKVKSISKISQMRGNQITYEVVMKGTTLIFDKDGNYLKEVKV